MISRNGDGLAPAEEAMHALLTVFLREKDGTTVPGANRELMGLARVEMRMARALLRYGSHPDFSSLLCDRSLFEFLAPLYLARVLNNAEQRRACLKSCKGQVQEEELETIVDYGSSLLDGGSSAAGDIPKIKAIVDKVINSKFFTHQPKLHESKRSPVLRFIREHKSKGGVEDAKLYAKLERMIVIIYKKADIGPPDVNSFYHPWTNEPSLPAPTPDEQRALLFATQIHPFFCDLITLKPPNSVHISHQQALEDCAEHARLWLFKSPLPVYYNFNVTYSSLARGAVLAEELQAWKSPVGFGALFPSCWEKRVRVRVLAHLRDQEEGNEQDNVHLLLPADYVGDEEDEDPVERKLAWPVTLRGKSAKFHARQRLKNKAIFLDLIEREPEDKFQALLAFQPQLQLPKRTRSWELKPCSSKKRRYALL